MFVPTQSGRLAPPHPRGQAMTPPRKKPTKAGRKGREVWLHRSVAGDGTVWLECDGKSGKCPFARRKHLALEVLPRRR